MNFPRAEDVQSVGPALAKLLATADRLEARHRQNVQQIEAVTLALDKSAARLDRGNEEFARSALQMISRSARQALAEGAGRSVYEFRQQLQQSTAAARSAALAMDSQRRGLAAARRTLVWNGLVALLVGSLLATGAAAWMVRQSMLHIAQAHFTQDVIQWTQSGKITRCGDLLCVKVGDKPQRYGKDGDYLLLQE